MFHTHLLVKGLIQNPPTVESVLNHWLVNLVDDINMKILDGPFIKYLDVSGNRGMTGIVMIETSHCSIHIWDEPTPAIFQMDVYSCADFKTESVLKRLEDFELIRLETMRIDRNDDLKVVEHFSI